MVQSRVEDLSTVVKKLSVELAPEQVKEEYEKALSGLSRRVKLKGYREGHAPKRLVERFYGDDVRRDVAQKLVQSTIFEAMEQHKLSPIAAPRVENGDVEPTAPFKYTATVEVRPIVDVKEWQGLSAPKIDLEVTEAEIDERLKQMQKEHSVFAPVEGRDIVEPGDYVVTDYEGSVDGAPLKGAKREGVLLEAVPGSLLENKAETLVGAKIGETRELGVTSPADYQVEELRGKEAPSSRVSPIL
ncbi:MAG: trigger factor, partial [Deltaproteobacteria bacterium]|nr:trigger factor [Deltaproteobacteria bacterium]